VGEWGGSSRGELGKERAWGIVGGWGGENRSVGGKGVVGGGVVGEVAEGAKRRRGMFVSAEVTSRCPRRE